MQQTSISWETVIVREPKLAEKTREPSTLRIEFCEIPTCSQLIPLTITLQTVFVNRSVIKFYKICAS